MAKGWTEDEIVEIIDAAIMGALTKVYDGREDVTYDVLWDKDTHRLWAEERRGDDIDDRGGAVMSVYTVMEYPENLESIEYQLKKSGETERLAAGDLKDEVLTKAFARYIRHGYRNEFARKIAENIW